MNRSVFVLSCYAGSPRKRDEGTCPTCFPQSKQSHGYADVVRPCKLCAQVMVKQVTPEKAQSLPQSAAALLLLEMPKRSQVKILFTDGKTWRPACIIHSIGRPPYGQHGQLK